MQTQQKKFKFSVIIPVYNVEEYLKETVDSVINQTIGFENIQLILVNDGSKDKSGEICKEYKEKYPNNVVFVDKENSGVSDTRNKGIEYIEGEYVNFLDSDDKWQLDAFEKVYDYFEKHFEEIDVVSCRIMRFDAMIKPHPTDFKYLDGNRIVDLKSKEDKYSVQISASNVFIKAEKLADKRFSREVKFGEDSLFINKIILEKMKYGILSDVVYHYRIRQGENSAVQTQLFNKSFYTDTVEKYHIGLANYCKEKYGEVYPYIQSVIIYDLGFRIAKSEFKEVLSKEEQKKYFSDLKIAFNNIDDEVIINHPIHKNNYKKFDMLSFKYGVNTLQNLKFSKKPIGMFLGDSRICKNFTTNLVNYTIENDTIHFEAFVAKWLFDATEFDVKITVKLGKETYTPKLEIFPNMIYTDAMGNETYARYVYKMSIPLNLAKNSRTKMKIFINYGEESAKMKLNYNKFLVDTSKVEKTYTAYENKYIAVFGEREIEIIYPNHFIKTHYEYEKALIEYIENYQDPRMSEEEIKAVRHTAEIRKKYWRHKLFNPDKRKIWYISDRIDNAGDNGDVFFRYLAKKKPKGIKPVFVIGKDYREIDRLKTLGKVVYANTDEALVYFLLADKVISSGASEFTINPFDFCKPFVIDLYKFKFYYLQHGIACADLSSWLSRYSKNIHRFFTSSTRERNSIIEGRYSYSPEQVPLTGMSRFDVLRNNPQKYILILPTWRRAITESYDDKTQSVYFDGFVETEFFKFYNSLINDERLLKVMREKGYQGKFCLHPIHKKQYVDFEGNDVFEINEGFVNYNDEFEKASVMVTDYSSVLFDFTYLRKAVVYSQFDKEKFFKSQIYDQGYFDYEKDGFGPVCYDLDSTVNELISLIENDCKVEKKYLDRMNGFYAFDDQNNCERIFNAIINE